MLHCLAQYCIVWRNIALFGAILHVLMQYCILWHNIALFGAILHCLVQYYCIVWRDIALFGACPLFVQALFRAGLVWSWGVLGPPLSHPNEQNIDRGHELYIGLAI